MIEKFSETPIKIEEKGIELIEEFSNKKEIVITPFKKKDTKKIQIKIKK